MFLFCLHLDTPSEINCLCFVPSLSFFLTSALKLNPPSYFKFNLQFVVLFKQTSHDILSSFQFPTRLLSHKSRKNPQDLLLKTKVSLRVCRDLLPLSSPALAHKAQSLVFAFTPRNAMSIGLAFNSHRVRMSAANRLTERENFKKLKGK